jgi:hypothetical protein
VRAEDSHLVFAADEIISILHDEGEQGRRFRMKGW